MRLVLIFIFLLSPLTIAQTLPAVNEPLRLAREAIADMDWRLAIDRYAPIRQSATPGDQTWSEAAFCLAVATHHAQPPSRKTLDAARALYQDVIDQSRQDRYVARALLSIGRIDELRDYPKDRIDLDAARRSYETVIRRFPDDDIASEAALRYAATWVMEFDAPNFSKVKHGIAYLEKWLADHPDDALAGVMWQYLGDSYFFPLDDYKNSLRCYEEVDKRGWSNQGIQEQWYWRCAVMAERYLSNRPAAIRYYTKIIVETPNSGKAYEAWENLQRLGAPLPRAPLLEGSGPTTREARP